MKRFISSFLAMTFLFGCGADTSNDTIEKAINGTYIRSSDHEFGSEYDTIVVSLQNREANEYKFIRKWQYNRILDGKQLSPDYKITTTTAVYDPATNSLTERETGDAYSFNAEKKLLFAGPTSYKKIN